MFGVSCSPFLLNAMLQHHLEKYITSHPKTVNKLTASLYVDDVITGANEEEEAYQLYFESKCIFKEGSFNFRKFVPNACSRRLMSSVHPSCDEQSSVSLSDETYTFCCLLSSALRSCFRSCVRRDRTGKTSYWPSGKS